MSKVDKQIHFMPFKKLFRALPLSLLLLYLCSFSGLFAQELIIYKPWMWSKENPGYISISETLGYMENKDSVVLEARYLGKDADKPKEIILSEKKRKIALQRAQINESDSIYIFNFLLDSICRIPVQGTQMKALPNIYGVGEIVQEYDYYIGFSIPRSLLFDQGDAYDITLAYIGKENPFQTGATKALIWNPIDSNEVPQIFHPRDTTSEYKDLFKASSCYHYKNGNLNYYLQKFTTNYKYMEGLRLLIINKENQVVYDGFYYDSEGAKLKSVSDSKTNPNRRFQWTGEILKGKPPVVYGFLSHPFGCSSIEFIGNERSIRIRCDNRH